MNLQVDCCLSITTILNTLPATNTALTQKRALSLWHDTVKLLRMRKQSNDRGYLTASTNTQLSASTIDSSIETAYNVYVFCTCSVVLLC